MRFPQRFISLSSLLLPLLFTTANASPAPAPLPAAPSSTPVPGHAFTRFITIWLENQDYDAVVANPHIQALAKEGILLSSYYAHTHPSQPNYLASIAGDYFGLNHDDFVQVPANVSTLVDLFDEAPGGDIDWRFYGEDMPGPGYMGVGSADVEGGRGGEWTYVRKHNPFVSFDSITTNGTRLLNILSLADFERDLAAFKIPQYSFITPNMLHDGHNSSLQYAAEWSSNFLTPLLSNEYFMKDTLILLTYDEALTYAKPNKIASLLLGGAVPDELKGTTDSTFYSHYSILSTLQNNWDLPNLGRFDVGANVFDLVAQKSGHKNVQPSDGAMKLVDLSISYGGFLNDDPGMFRPIPPPNQGLVGAGGKGVAEKVKESWASAAQESTPYDGLGRIWQALDFKPPVAAGG